MEFLVPIDNKEVDEADTWQCWEKKFIRCENEGSKNSLPNRKILLWIYEFLIFNCKI